MPVIATNTAANSALRYLNLNSEAQSSSLSKLASGSRITKASDDAAGLAIGTRIQSDVTVLSQAATNASQATAILQTADGGLARISDILQRMKSLATQSDSGSVTDSERTYIDAEYQELLEEIDGIASSTRYNGVSLLDGTGQYASSSANATVSSNWMTDAQYSDITDSADADVFTITTSDGNTVTYTVSDAYDGTTGSVSLEDIAASINAGDTTTPEAANVTATVETDDDGRQRLVLTGVDGATVTAMDDTTGTTLQAVGMLASDGTTIVGGSKTGVDFMVGTTSTDTINVSIDDVDSTALGLAGTSVDTQTNSETALTALDAAIDAVIQARAEVGATMSRFEFRSETIDTTSENLQSAESAIMDADVAAEKSELSSADVKTQAAIAALSQANQMPQNLLSLLKS
ncbi:flagellin [Magnetospirillum sp. 64-120]|uniref:flagellin N-terminal helical domain-containing protein n=1 Tax=Magnetospirillum sp. 64-120 TaxID=1895778 RepID=UPI000A69E853|nr:flagellin [Magnetospirillum sp. 64-120]